MFLKQKMQMSFNKGKSVLFYLAALIACIGIIKIIRNNEVRISFYYWKSTFKLTDHDRELLKELSCKRMYVHFFDVDKKNGNPEAFPLANIRFNESFPEHLNLVPVVYITQRTLNNAGREELKQLANHVYVLAKQMSANAFTQWAEFQIDCDWTEENKEAYFNFLIFLKKELPPDIPLSATIRLHQIKYFERTGVPPVDRGTLMFYNMGEIKSFTFKNSIYDYATADAYVERISKYKLPLDYALPAFGWGLHYRLNKLQSILQETELNEIKKSDLFSKYQNTFICKRAGFLNETYYLKGDVVKEEFVDYELCRKAARQLTKHTNSDEFELIFYHLGSTQIQNYAPKQLKDIGNLFN